MVMEWLLGSLQVGFGVVMGWLLGSLWVGYGGDYLIVLKKLPLASLWDLYHLLCKLFFLILKKTIFLIRSCTFYCNTICKM